ncbi:MAG: hypothetical protein ACRD5L_10290, partial [Bryobacteraceae bacterium]
MTAQPLFFHPSQPTYAPIRFEPHDRRTFIGGSDAHHHGRRRGQAGPAVAGEARRDRPGVQIQLITLLAPRPRSGSPRTAPVCPTAGSGDPDLRLRAVVALVGIAGEDDFDAPDLLVEPPPMDEAPADSDPGLQTPRKPSNGSVHKPRQPNPVQTVWNGLRDCSRWVLQAQSPSAGPLIG